MTITVTSIGTDSQLSNASDLTVGPFTPNANSMLLAVIHGGNTLTVNGLSGHTGGAAWSRIAQFTDWSVARDYEIWACFPGASPSSATVAVDINYADLSLVQVLEVTGDVDTSGTVANAFGVNDSDSATAASWTCTPAAFASAMNATLGIMALIDSTPELSWPGGYSTVAAFTYSVFSIQVGWIDEEDSSVAVSNTSSVTGLLYVTEIKAAAAGGSIVSHRMALLGVG